MCMFGYGFWVWLCLPPPHPALWIPQQWAEGGPPLLWRRPKAASILLDGEAANIAIPKIHTQTYIYPNILYILYILRKSSRTDIIHQKIINNWHYSLTKHQTLTLFIKNHQEFTLLINNSAEITLFIKNHQELILFIKKSSRINIIH